MKMKKSEKIFITFCLWSGVLIYKHKAAVKLIVSFEVEIDCYYLHVIGFKEKKLNFGLCVMNS